MSRHVCVPLSTCMAALWCGTPNLPPRQAGTFANLSYNFNRLDEKFNENYEYFIRRVHSYKSCLKNLRVDYPSVTLPHCCKTLSIVRLQETEEGAQSNGGSSTFACCAS